MAFQRLETITTDQVMADKMEHGDDQGQVEAPLSYSNLHRDISCKCTNGLNPDTVSTFIRRSKREHLDERDFVSHWDNPQMDREVECEGICGQKGLSMSKLDAASPYIERAKAAYPTNPKYKPFLHFIKLTASCGCVKHTPNTDDQYHHDLYTSDVFDWKKISGTVKHLGDA